MFFPAPTSTPLKANVMLEYDIDEAQALLEKNLSTASRNLETLEDDLDFLRDQFTTTEVSILPLRSPLRLGLLLIYSDRKFCRTVSQTHVLFVFQSDNTSSRHCFYFVPWNLHYKKWFTVATISRLIETKLVTNYFKKSMNLFLSFAGACFLNDFGFATFLWHTIVTEEFFVGWTKEAMLAKMNIS